MYLNDLGLKIIFPSLLTNPKLKIMDEYRYRHDWPKWKEIIQTELNSLHKTRNIWTYSPNA